MEKSMTVVDFKREIEGKLHSAFGLHGFSKLICKHTEKENGLQDLSM